MDSRQRKTIIRLQELDPHSIEFYDVATGYFRRRSRSTRNCGIIFCLFELVGLMRMFAPWENWSGHLQGVFIVLFFGLIGWNAYRMGNNELILIKASRVAGPEYQAEALRVFCRYQYSAQPIGVYILRRLGEGAQPTLPPAAIKGRKRDLAMLKMLFPRRFTDQKNEQRMKKREDVLRDKVNRKLEDIVGQHRQL